MKRIAIARSVLPLLVLAVLALAPQSANACVATYMDVSVSDYDVSATGFVEDFYNSEPCFFEVYYQWWYWEHSYTADISIVSPTYRTASITYGMSDVPFGGGFANAFALLSTTEEVGVYSISVVVAVICTIGGEFVEEELTQQRNLPPRPVNFREKIPGSGSFGTLHFEYEWDSSSGSLANLSNCRVGENVAYPNGDPFNWYNPPYGSPTNVLQTSPNPFVKITVHGDDGQLKDDHMLPLQFYPAAQQQANSFTATQLYGYTCPGINGGQPVFLSGSDAHHMIGREVVNENGTWKYKLSKAGLTSSYNIP